MKHKPATLFLEDGFSLEGLLYGAEEVEGEVVFNTAMTGYQEILTDPSYKGQIVCMSYPLIGNYGINAKDVEGERVWTEALVVKELSRIYSATKAEGALIDYLFAHKVPLFEKSDTRSLVRHLRLKGAMRGVISARNDTKYLEQRVKKVVPIEEKDLVNEAACRRSHVFKDEDERAQKPLTQFKVVVVDCGVKMSILRQLKRVVKEVIVVPSSAPLGEILKFNPDGLVFSNGPGDPARCTGVVATMREVIGSLQDRTLNVAVLGICLGHQLLGIALGGTTRKLKFGHHGGNHPVKDLSRNRIFITSQNHNFIVDINSPEVEETHINLYDKTPEGMRHRKLPIFSVQFHPEAGPGPEDMYFIFEDFVKMIEKTKK